jgi:hypothetical protein
VQQGDTAVLAGHRGHGLGLSIKATMAKNLVAAHPDLRYVTTTVADTNLHMLRVNELLGWETTRTIVTLSEELELLRGHPRLGRGN